VREHSLYLPPRVKRAGAAVGMRGSPGKLGGPLSRFQ
jgi:hypothetical protein